MKIIQHGDCFEVRTEDGSIVRQFAFDDDASRRAINGKMNKKQAFQAAKTFAGKGLRRVPRRVLRWSRRVDEGSCYQGAAKKREGPPQLVCDQAATLAMFRTLEQHFGLATKRLFCFDLITGRGEFH
jgi:hypothetical protein